MTRHLSQSKTILESKWPETQRLKNKVQVKMTRKITIAELKSKLPETQVKNIVQVKMTRNPSQSEIILKSKWPEIQRFKSKIRLDDQKISQSAAKLM